MGQACCAAKTKDVPIGVLPVQRPPQEEKPKPEPIVVKPPEPVKEEIKEPIIEKII